MKKELVFVIPSLTAGGAEKSLVNLLNTIDYSAYNVDLILFHQSGLFLKMLPKEVRIVAIEGNYSTFSKGLFGSCFGFLKKLRLDLLTHRFLFFYKNFSIKNKAVAEQKAWKNFRSSMPDFNKKYDAAIGFLEKSSIYFAVDKIKANKKIGWIHTNYSNSGMNAEFDLPYFQKLDALIGVSPECVEDLNHNFPIIQNKIKIIYNIVSPDLIKALAQEKIVDSLVFTSANTLLTVARLSNEKGVDLALETSKILKEKGVDFNWMIIGDGVDRAYLETKIKEYQLENQFQLLGLKENPYPYLKASTIYVQPSRYEGKSMAIEEAKILQKPIVITNFATALDQITPMQNGVIAEMSPIRIADEISNLINNQELRNKLSLNLSKENLGTKDEIIKLYQLINE